MKKTRLKDVLDDKPVDIKRWRELFGKMRKLATLIEMVRGPEMNIDDVDYRWVDDRIKYFDNDNRLLSKDEMIAANRLWNKYVQLNK